MGRTFNTPILKLGVNCIAAISNEKEAAQKFASRLQVLALVGAVAVWAQAVPGLWLSEQVVFG